MKYRVIVPGSKHILTAEDKHQAIDKAIEYHINKLREVQSNKDIYKVPDVAVLIDEEK